MGTRSTIHFQEDGKTICSIYQQYGGYPNGVGLQLADFLNGITIVNGINPDKGGRLANGVGCLAAQFIADHKRDAGGLYITNESDRQEYDYFVNYKTKGDGFLFEYEDEPEITCGPFVGNRKQFLEWCKEPEFE